MEEETEMSLQSPFPVARVKKIVKLDTDINKLTSEALLLISSSAELFIQFLAEQSSEVATEKKRKTVKLEHLRAAVKRHRPSSDFLLDSLPQAEPDPPRPSKPQPRSRASSDIPSSSSVRRIDSFFRKPAAEKEIEESAQPELHPPSTVVQTDNFIREPEITTADIPDMEVEESEQPPTVLQTDSVFREPEITVSEKENEESEQPESLAPPTVLQTDSLTNEPEITAAEKEIEVSEQLESLAPPTVLQTDSLTNEPEITAAEKEIEVSEQPE